MSNPSKMSQVQSGFRSVALILIGFVVGGMFFGGVASLLSPNATSRWLGPVFLIISTPIMILTMKRWAKVMAGFLGLAVLNGLVSLSSGHVLANPTMPISRPDALYLTVFYATATMLAATITQRTLNLVDRISVMAFLYSLAFLITYQARLETAKSALFNATAVTLIGIGLCCLLVPWVYNHFQHRRGRKRRSTTA
jgi:hypothetical protein